MSREVLLLILLAWTLLLPGPIFIFLACVIFAIMPKAKRLDGKWDWFR